MAGDAWESALAQASIHKCTQSYGSSRRTDAWIPSGPGQRRRMYLEVR
jgi:hypothetical protein